MFEDFACCTSGSTSADLAFARKGALLAVDPRGDSCQSHTDPLGEAGLCDRSAGTGPANGGSAGHGSFVAAHRCAVASEIDAVGLRVLSHALVLRTAGSSLEGTSRKGDAALFAPSGDGFAGG